MIKIIYLLKFTSDDGATFKVNGREFFINRTVAQEKANRLNLDLPDLRRYEVETVPISWDEPE
jgi:hypothetical protein